MWNLVWGFIKPHLLDKAFWVTILGWLIMGANKWFKLGFDDNAMNAIVVALAGYFVTHLAHSNTVSKEKPNA